MKVKLYVLQRASLCLTFFFLFLFSSFSQQVAKSIPNSTSPDGRIGFLEFRPSDYGSQKHPLIIFLHGIGERGDGLTQINNVAANAIPNFCANGATMRFTVNGKTSSFVVLSPQLSTQYGYWPTFYIREMIKYAKANLQIDTNRIYLTGLSLGGGGIWRMITDADNWDYTFDAGIAAAAPVCGTQEENDATFCGTIGANHLPIWAFHCMDDGTVAVQQTQHAEILAANCGVTPKPKFTYYQSGNHWGAWVYAYDTGHITNVLDGGSSFTANPNMYEWFLSNSRGSATPPTGNQPPVANAGGNQTISFPATSATLTGTGTGTNGATISSYAWSKTSGPSSGTITASNAASTTVTALVAGTYVFTLTVTDNHGLTGSSTVTIIVKANQAPLANAGTNIVLTLPVNSTTLDGSASYDPDGFIASVQWSEQSGPSSYTLGSPVNNFKTSLSNLVQGVYVFKMLVTDNVGATASSTVTVTVNAAANQSPVANAGNNISITLPTNTATLNGSASNDPDGSISSYAWTKTSGPATYNIANANAATTGISNLVQGSYVFKLTVTDNAGATASSTVTVNVNAAANQSPVANAGNNISITLPTNTVTLNGSASNDPDGSISSYAWTKTSGPATYNITNANAAITGINNLVQGSYVFKLTVTDNAGATASSTVTVNVNAAANQSPVANAGNNISITLPTNTATLNGSASNDPDGSISSYAWTKTSGPATYNITNANAATTGINNLVQGSYVFKLTVTDNAGATASSTVTVNVNAAANQSPVANAGNNISITLPTNTATLNGSASNDPDGSISSYAWTKTSGPATYNITNANAATTGISNLVQGSYVFTLTVTDNVGATAASTVTVNVNAVANQSPVANAGSNTSITLPTNTATLNGSASNDPDGSISSYAWTKTSGPGTYNIANANAATTGISNLVQGSYVFTLTVTDNVGATAASTVTVNVNAVANQSPVANAGSNTSITLPTNTATLNGSASNDPDGSISSYAWTKTSGPGTYNIANANAATTGISNLVQGSYVFTLTVTDNAGATASSTVTITVNPMPNKAPVANAGTDITITLPVNTTALDGSRSSDPDGTIAAYSWNKISGPGAVTIVNSNTAAPSVIGLTQGQYVFELTVTDFFGASGTDQVVVTVNPIPNKAPVANAGKDTSIALPVDAVLLSGSHSADADGTITAYKWKEVSGPSAAAIVQAGSATTEVNGLIEGDYVFELQVTDNGGATATARVTVSVVNNFRYSQLFKVFPNPATSNISFQYIDDKTGKLQAVVYDINGKLVINQSFSKDQSLITQQVNISSLNPGMYYLEISLADGKKIVRPFVKQ